MEPHTRHWKKLTRDPKKLTRVGKKLARQEKKLPNDDSALHRHHPRRDPLFQHVHREGAGAEDLVVEGPDVEAGRSFAALKRSEGSPNAQSPAIRRSFAVFAVQDD